MIATDLDNARTVVPVLRVCGDAPRIMLLSTYRIPFSGLHMLSGRRRLEAAIEQTAREDMQAFVQSSDIDRVVFEMLLQRRDLEDHLLRDIVSGDVDLLALAMKPETLSARRIARLLEPLLARGSCDVIIVRSHFDSELNTPELLPAVP